MNTIVFIEDFDQQEIYYFLASFWAWLKRVMEDGLKIFEKFIQSVWITRLEYFGFGEVCGGMEE